MYQKKLEDIKTQINKSGVKSAVCTCALFLFFFHYVHFSLCSFFYLKFCILDFIIGHIFHCLHQVDGHIQRRICENLIDMYWLFLVSLNHH